MDTNDMRRREVEREEMKGIQQKTTKDQEMRDFFGGYADGTKVCQHLRGEKKNGEHCIIRIIRREERRNFEKALLTSQSENSKIPP